ncbi:MAG TPA: squalene/phytoene synthase family protein [Pseudonocardiaceae bacterium]|nr:squalene/phytoene synthase family protein [Pseudonocardiaceae bacterium]
MSRVTVGVDEAFEVCESITRTQARNFYYGIRLLRPDKRAALCAVYALARQIDDIGDGDLPRGAKLAALAGVRCSLADLSHPGDDPVLTAVADLAGRLPLPLSAFGELVRGVEMDVLGRRYAEFDELVGYCRCVAGAVGRLCLAVFGSRPDPRAPEYADALGIALQQINILRDIREDFGNDRVYLPQHDLDRFGVQLTLDEQGDLVDPGGRLTALIQHCAERAYQWYEHGLRLIPLLDRRSAACCTTLSGIYLRLLERIAAQPSLVFDRRLSLSGWQKAEVAMRALAGLPPSALPPSGLPPLGPSASGSSASGLSA